MKRRSFLMSKNKGVDDLAVLNATTTTVKQLLQNITSFLIDSNNFTTGNAWQLMSPAAITGDTTEVILKGVGDGKDEIYVGMKIKAQGQDQENIVLNGFTGYDPGLEWYEQPGAIYRDSLPCVPLAKDVFMTYWLVANTSRFTFRVEMSNHYEAAYLGFIKPIAIARQYPYPLLIGGSAYEGISWNSKADAHSTFLLPTIDSNGYSSLCIRRADGVWRYGGKTLLTWPNNTGPIDTFTVYRKNSDLNALEDNMLYPVVLYETDPVGMIGELDGIYWLGNRADLAVKDNIVYKDKVYKIFNNVYRRDDDAYHAMEWS